MKLTVVIQRTRRIQRHHKRDAPCLHSVARHPLCEAVLVAVALHTLDPERMVDGCDVEDVCLTSHQTQGGVGVAVDGEARHAIVLHSEVRKV